MFIQVSGECFKITEFEKIDDLNIVYSADAIKKLITPAEDEGLKSEEEFYSFWDILMDFEDEVKALERHLTGVFTNIELSLDNMYRMQGCFKDIKTILDAYEFETVKELIQNKQQEFNFFVALFWNSDSITKCFPADAVKDVTENVRAVLEGLDRMLLHIKQENRR